MPRITNAMTVDVEDYFQVEAFASVVPPADWDSFPSRVAANTDLLLARFEAAGVKATFFTLGWVAERHPDGQRGGHLRGVGLDHPGVGRPASDRLGQRHPLSPGPFCSRLPVGVTGMNDDPAS